MKVELKKVKIAKFLSEETTAFSAQLWVDGEYIADVSNEGRGGNNRINQFVNGDNTRDKVEAFEKWCKEQPPYVDEDGELSMNDDLYISRMVEDYQEQQQLKRWCKTKTIIRLEGTGKGEYLAYKRPYSAYFAQRGRATEPKLVEIINERFI